MTTTCTRRIQFCAGHRVLGHESKCANMHGHNYVALVTAEGSLDGIGRVIDFSVLKEKVGGWIEENWDHGFIVYDKDDAVRSALAQVPGQKRCVTSFNPTAENLAGYLLELSNSLLLKGTGVLVTAVELWETENCRAEVRR